MAVLDPPRNVGPFSQARKSRTAVACIPVPSQGVISYLGAVCRDRREEADVVIAEVIARLRHDFGVTLKSDGALSRFERGETTPRFLDSVLAAYAAETGDDAADYWNEALERYKAGRPENEAAPSTRFDDAFSARRGSRAKPSEKSSAKKSRRGAPRSPS